MLPSSHYSSSCSRCYRRDHWEFVRQLKEARIAGLSEVHVQPFQKYGLETPWGPIRFIYPPEDMQKMAYYQGYPDIKIIMKKSPS